MKSFLVVVSSMLALSACSCSRTVREDRPASEPSSPRSRVVDRSQVHFDKSAGRQVQMARWARDGMWVPARASGATSAVLYASDRFGTRIVSLSRSTGYDVHEVKLDCQHDLVGYLDSRSAPSDQDAPDLLKKGSPLSFGVPPVEVKRLCAIGRNGALGGQHLLLAVQNLRAGSAKTAPSAPDVRTFVQRPREPSKEDRARMWAEYQKQHGG